MTRTRATRSSVAAPALLSGTNVARAGDHNQRVTLQAIRVAGAATRLEVAAMTGLTPAAVANIAARLVKDRLVVETGHRRGMRGKPSMRLAINPVGRFSVGLNVDRDHLTMVVVDFTGTVRGRVASEMRFARPDDVRAFITRGFAELVAGARVPRSRLEGCGVAFPDDLTRTVLPDQPADYAEWQRTSVGDLVEDALGLPTVVENDAAAAAIGEMQFGSGQQYRSFFYVLVTAALGGGLVLDGSYFRGANGRSGEIGLMHARNRAGEDTELQKIVSLSALYTRLADRGVRVTSPAGLSRLEPVARAVVDAWISESTEALVGAFTAINCLVNPEAILIGGRLPAELVDRLATSLNARMAGLATELPSNAPVARAATADDAPAVGAAILPFSDRFLPTRFALFKTI
jgi:predicted NBD/HSP70 family sugar kinase